MRMCHLLLLLFLPLPPSVTDTFMEPPAQMLVECLESALGGYVRFVFGPAMALLDIVIDMYACMSTVCVYCTYVAFMAVGHKRRSSLAQHVSHQSSNVLPFLGRTDGLVRILVMRAQLCFCCIA